MIDINDATYDFDELHEKRVANFGNALSAIVMASEMIGLDPIEEGQRACLAMLDAAIIMLAIPDLKNNHRVDKMNLARLIMQRLDVIEPYLTHKLRPIMQKGATQ